MASAIQSYAGVPTPAFLFVEKIQFSVLPASEVKQISIPMKSGDYFVNKKHGARTFTVEFTIKSDNRNGVMYSADDLATWLNHDEPKELIFRDKPDITYYAIVDDSVELTKFSNSAKGSIRFICYDPFGYGTEREYEFNPTDTEPVMVVNGGNTDTAPKIEFEFSQNVTDFSIQTDDNMLYFGEPFDESTQTKVNLNPQLIGEGLVTTSGWTEGLTIDGGHVMGTISSNGYSFSQTGEDYGTNTTAWHGGALIKSIGREIQDFTIETNIGFNSSNKNQLGRVELYLLDINGNKIGKIALVDTSGSGEYPLFEARAGGLTNGHYFSKHYGSKPYTFDNFKGLMRISRKGNNWSAYIAKITNGTHHTRMTKTWKDTGNKYMNKVASIQLHIGANKSHPPVDTMYFDYVRVTEHLKGESNEIGYVFKSGDKLYIDNNTGVILKNGEPFYDRLYPSSSFLTLQKGVNGISVSEPVVINGTLSFRERWL